MTIFYFAVIISISIYEVYRMIKKNLRKELGLFLFFVLIALVLSWSYSKNPYGISIADSILSAFGIEH